MIILDFDDTLFDTTEWKKYRAEALQQSGVSPELFQETYLTIRHGDDRGYSNHAHAELLAAYGLPEKEIEKSLELTSGPEVMQRFLFPDARWFLEELRKKKEKIMLITLGDPAFQKIKLDAAGIYYFFDETYFVNHHKEKQVPEIAAQAGLGETVWFINDVIDESRMVCEACPQLKVVLKQKEMIPDEEYVRSGFPYFKTFVEIMKYVNTHS